MGKKPSFSDLTKRDKEIKKRLEIRDEILIWADSKDFIMIVEEILKKGMRDHDELRTLSSRLHEHETFSSKIKEIAKAVYEECGKSNRLGFIDKWWSQIAILIITASTAVLAARFIPEGNKQSVSERTGISQQQLSQPLLQTEPVENRNHDSSPILPSYQRQDLSKSN